MAVYDSNGDNQSTESGARAVGDILSLWCDQLEAGAVELPGEAARREFGGFSTDMMSALRARAAVREHEAPDRLT